MLYFLSSRILFGTAQLYIVEGTLTDLCTESVVVIPPHGVQLETHRGLFNVTLFIQRRFIPRAVLRDVVVHEGLRLWNVRYFLAFVKRDKNGSSIIDIAFEVSNVLFYSFSGMSKAGCYRIFSLTLLSSCKSIGGYYIRWRCKIIMTMYTAEQWHPAIDMKL